MVSGEIRLPLCTSALQLFEYFFEVERSEVWSEVLQNLSACLYEHVFFGCQIFVITKLSKITKMSIYGVQIVRQMFKDRCNIFAESLIYWYILDKLKVITNKQFWRKKSSRNGSQYALLQKNHKSKTQYLFNRHCFFEEE